MGWRRQSADRAAEIVVAGSPRQYLLHRPSSHSGRNTLAPLVIMLHGGFGSAQHAQWSYGWDDVADAHGFVVAYPNGLRRSWNAGTCCGPAMRAGIDDVEFIDTLITKLENTESIDPDRVYVAGMSNGAMMAYRLACDLPGRLAAIGPVAGTMTVPLTTSSTPTSVCHIHGLADQNAPFDGGIGRRGAAKDARPSITSVIAHWRAIDECGPSTESDNGPVHLDTADGPLNQEVTLITIVGAGHQWPGSRSLRRRGGRMPVPDPPSTALDATTTLWQFFTAHTRHHTSA